jgi:predicted O-methyltransferase YrrM
MVGCAIGTDVPHSQTTQTERAALSKYARGKRRGVEIGVHEGVTTCLIAEQFEKDGILFSIDPFLKGRLGICWSKLIARKMIRDSKLQSRVRLIEKYSYEAVGYLTGQFDFVFLDGDHSLAGIERDWNDWSGRIPPGGIMAVHDSLPIAANVPVTPLGSVAYFENQIRHDERFEIIEQIDSLSVLRRRS